MVGMRAAPYGNMHDSHMNEIMCKSGDVFVFVDRDHACPGHGKSGANHESGI